MKVAFFSSFIQTPHYETELELIQHHLDKGDEVIHLICKENLEVCLANPTTHNKLTCINCQSRRDLGKKLLSKKIKTYSLSSFLEKKYFLRQITTIEKKFSTLSDLKGYKIENFDIGNAVASTMISIYKDAAFNPSQQVEHVEKYIINAFKIFEIIKNFLDTESPEAFYIFNGRFAHERAALRACQQKGITCYIHERGNSKDHYEIYTNKLPHELSYFKECVSKAWENPSLEKHEIGKKFYQEKLQKKDRIWHSMVENQKWEKLPESWNKSNYNIVIFNSSENEFASIDESWNDKLYKTQAEALKILSDLLKQKDLRNTKIYLRIHPYINIVNNIKEEEALVKFLGEDTIYEIISSKSDISSYSLLLESDKVLTFGSTMGIEATFWEKPSILLGRSPYEDLEATYNVTSYQETLELLLNKDILAKPREGAIKYGYYLSTYGIPYSYYKADTLFSGSFKGVVITPYNILKYNFIRSFIIGTFWKKLKNFLKCII